MFAAPSVKGQMLAAEHVRLPGAFRRLGGQNARISQLCANSGDAMPGASRPSMTRSQAGGRLLTVVDLGRTRYAQALARQTELLALRRRDCVGDTLLLTEHEPVVTLGRSTEEPGMPDAEALERAGIELHEATRGGKVTYHGPGQLVGYPILDLRALFDGRPDLHRFVQGIETVLVQALQDLGIPAQSREGLRGVWVQCRKIASIGVAVRGWVSYHGFALNVCNDLSPFRLIEPCGLPDVEMTSMSVELGREVAVGEVAGAVVDRFAEHFGMTALRQTEDPTAESLPLQGG